jgi:valyl-tRNA synthetase
MNAEYTRNSAQLQNEGFLVKAPAKVVEGLKTRRAELESLIEKAKSRLDELDIK